MRRHINYLIFITLIIIFPAFVRDNYTLSIAIFAGINALLAMGLSLLMGYAGQVSLGQAGFYGIGAYVSAIIAMKFGMPIVFSAFLAALVAAFAAVLLAIPALKLKGHYLAVATLGFGEIIYIILNELGPGGPSGFGDIPKVSFMGYKLTGQIGHFYLIWFIVFVLIIFSYNIINSRIGRAMRAIHDTEIGSSAMGIDVSALKIKIFVLSAIYASIAGSFYAHYITFISPSTFSLFHSVLILTMVVIGGASNLFGAVVGAIIITILPEALRKFEELDVLIYGLILTLSLLFIRKGIVPTLILKLKKKGIANA